MQPRIDLYPTDDGGGVKTVSDQLYRVVSETDEPQILIKTLSDSYTASGYDVYIHNEPEAKNVQA